MTIQEIKKTLSIETVLNHYGHLANKNNMLCCPFHTDKTPSLQIYPKTNSFCCFSTACSAGTGDQLKYIELMEVQLGQVAGDQKTIKHHAIKLAKDLCGWREESLLEVFTKLRSSLLRSKKAQTYALDRGLAIKNLEVGYNGGFYKDLKNCLVFPLKDESGRIVSLYGRSIAGNSSHRHFYQRGRSGFYPSCPGLETEYLILTEGVIDAASLMQGCDLPKEYSVLALYGAKVLGADQERALRSLSKLKGVILYFDGDEAGRQGGLKWKDYLGKLLQERQIVISQVPVPMGEDINSLLQSHERGVLKALLDDRKVLSEVFLSTEKETAAEKTIEKKKSKLDVSNPSMLVYQSGVLLFSMIGGVGSRNLEKLRLTLKVERVGASVGRLRHSFDLYNDDHLEKYAQKAADRLDVGIELMRRGLYELIDEVEAYRLSQAQVSKGAVKVELSESRKSKAIAYLKAPYLLDRTNADIGKTGVVGEEINRLLMYLCFTSRKRSQPLHVLTLGGSGSGKTYLQERIGLLMPEEDVLQCTASTENAFYYIKDGDLRHKLVLLEDLDGADSSLYILRELMSKTWASKLVPVKDASGKTETVRLPIYGPICLAATTTRDSLYEDNANRSLLIYPDGSKAHQESIMESQRKLSAGLIYEKEQVALRSFMQDVQRVLEPIKVRNPYAEKLRIPESCFKPLRTHAHYLHFIETVTFYHQYQREVKRCEVTGENYIETTLEDIEAANGLIQEVLLRKSDELSGACRNFLERLKKWLALDEKASFKSSEVIQGLRMAPRSVYRYIGELKSYDYVRVTGGGRYQGGSWYELVSGKSYGDLSGAVSSVLENLLKELRKTKK